MTRYFFHIRDGDKLLEDFDGTELPDLRAAVADARMSAQEIMGERLKRGLDPIHRSFEITNAEGLVLATLPFSDVLMR